MGELVASRTSSPTRRSSSNYGGKSPASSWLLSPTFFFFFFFLFVLAATTLGLAPFPTFGVGWACQAWPYAFVCRAKKLCDILDVMHGELFQHLLIPHTLVKCDYNRSMGNMRNGVANMREPLDKGAQRFPQTSTHGVEIGLIAWPRVCTLEVGCELMTHLLPRGESALRQVHEP
jgi:hypothetical protein